jgi:hypothetical protein
MIIDELKEKGINSTERAIEYMSRSQNRLDFFLPENLSKLIAEIAHSGSPQSCINLNSNIGEILSKCTRIENRFGVDANAQNVELAKYLNPGSHFEKCNPLEYNTNKKFDVAICFPPLDQRIEINGKKTMSEILYVSKVLEFTNDNGKSILILPNNFSISQIFKDTRNNILNKFNLEQIIFLPKRVFRNTGVDLSIIVISKEPISKTNFLQLESIDFSISDYLNNTSGFSVAMKNLTERWDYNFHNPINREFEKELSTQITKKLGELVEVFVGTHFSKDEFENNGEYLWLTSRNISKGELQFSKMDKYVTKEKLCRREHNAILQNGDILIPIIQRNKEAFYVHSEKEQKLIAFQHFAILRGKNAEYVATYLNTENGINLFNQQVERHTRGSIVQTISISDLMNIEIPILPIKDLELASKIKLENLSYEELLSIKDEYDKLKQEYSDLKSSHRQILDAIQYNHDIVMETVGRIENKVDDIKSTLNELTKDFKHIKELPRDIDEKINRLIENLDNKLKKLLTDQKQLDFYIEEIKRWFEFYDILESKSQKYLPEAEYIFDQISKLENPDYSPFILQYCRALENELLKKIFRSYVQSLIDRKVNIETSFAWDLGHKESGKLNSEDTSKITKHLQRCLGKPEDQWFFELGSMQVNLRYLTGKTAKKSPLLKDLKSFVLNRFKQEILNIEYLDDIKIIIYDFRNQSAHPNLIDIGKAVEFHKQMKKCLIRLLESFRKE